MTPQDALTSNLDQLHEHLLTLDDEQLVTFLTAIDAAEIIAKNKTISLTDSARYIATAWGWPVFPIVARGKRPLTKHGFKDATTNTAQISDWWAQWPDANIGTPTV